MSGLRAADRGCLSDPRFFHMKKPLCDLEVHTYLVLRCRLILGLNKMASSAFYNAREAPVTMSCPPILSRPCSKNMAGSCPRFHNGPVCLEASIYERTTCRCASKNGRKRGLRVEKYLTIMTEGLRAATPAEATAQGCDCIKHTRGCGMFELHNGIEGGTLGPTAFWSMGHLV